MEHEMEAALIQKVVPMPKVENDKVKMAKGPLSYILLGSRCVV